MIEMIVLPVTGLTTSAVKELKAPFRIRAVEAEWGDAGGAVQKVFACWLSDPAGLALWRTSTPLLAAGSTVFACFGVGMSHGSGFDAVANMTWAQSSLPSVWVDQDSQLNLQPFTAEAATFIVRAVLYVEKHDLPIRT